MLGLSVANVVGVPAATWLGQLAGWRAAYIATASIAVATMLMVLLFVPSCRVTRGPPGGAGCCSSRNGQAMLTLLAGAVGFGGLFAVYSYIAPTVTDVGGLPGRPCRSSPPRSASAWSPAPARRPAGGWSVFRSLILSGVASFFVMFLVWALAPYGWWLLPAIFLVTAIGSVLVVNLQLRLMSVSGEAPDARRRDEPRVAQPRQRARRLARRRGHRRGLRLPRPGAGRGRAVRARHRGALLVGGDPPT